jgi:hypothetical protein
VLIHLSVYSHVCFFHRAEAEANAWSETIQTLNARQTSILEALAQKAERRKALQTEFQTSWNARAKGKGKSQADDHAAEDDGFETTLSVEKIQAHLLSKIWDWSLDDVSKDEALSLGAELVMEEMKAGIGVLDEEEKKLEARIRDIEPLVSRTLTELLAFINGQVF